MNASGISLTIAVWFAFFHDSSSLYFCGENAVKPSRGYSPHTEGLKPKPASNSANDVLLPFLSIFFCRVAQIRAGLSSKPPPSPIHFLNQSANSICVNAISSIPGFCSVSGLVPTKIKRFSGLDIFDSGAIVKNVSQPQHRNPHENIPLSPRHSPVLKMGMAHPGRRDC